MPFREIELSGTRRSDGSSEPNPPVRLYDTSGPWTDADRQPDIRRGLPPVRAAWIEERGDTEAYPSRIPIESDSGSAGAFPNLPSRRMRAKRNGRCTQLYYARKGVITPEMEFVAIRKNLGREEAEEPCYQPNTGGPGILAHSIRHMREFVKPVDATCNGFVLRTPEARIVF